jgi:hypothetical protein
MVAPKMKMDSDESALERRASEAALAFGFTDP